MFLDTSSPWLTLSGNDFASLGDQLREDGVAQVSNPLSQECAEDLGNELDKAAWNLVIWLNDEVFQSDLTKLTAAKERELVPFAQAQADTQFRFAYDRVALTDRAPSDHEPSPCLKQLHDTWAHPKALGNWSNMLAGQEVTSLSMQATRFRREHFLTPHDDSHRDGAPRLVAFVLSLATAWQSHWGGQTHIEDTRGQTRVITPGFNTLTLFTVPRGHFVSLVASYAPPRGRVAISGCLFGG